MSSGLRRVVTGHNVDGLSTVRSDSPIVLQDSQPGISSGLKWARVWATEETPTKDNNNDVDGALREVKADGGFNFPGGTNCTIAEMEPGAEVAWYRTSTLDHTILISGKLIAVMEDGKEILLEEPGSFIILRGTMRAWRNPGPEKVRFANVLVDAEPAVVGGKVLTTEFKMRSV